MNKELIVEVVISSFFPAGVDQEDLNNESPYNIMFGPDICGSTKRTHVIFNYKGENKLVKREVKAETDELTHVYTLIVRPDQTYEVLIDGEPVQSGDLVDDWDFLPAKEIFDPSVSKPEDWVDLREIDDPEDIKPEDYDSVPAEIPDPKAAKPEDWDSELDGEWEPNTIPNPEYQGEWKPKKISNPEYKGEWVHPKISNPDYSHDATIYSYESFKYLGLEIWQVKSGTIFDNFLVTDDVEYAKEVAKRAEASREGEKAAKEKEEEENRVKAKAEAEAAAASSSEKDDDSFEEEEEIDLDLEEEVETTHEEHHDEL